jgi:DNA replication protein DnaC
MEAQARLLRKRAELKAMGNPTLSITKDSELNQIFERIKEKSMSTLTKVDWKEKPDFMSEDEWEEENKIEVEDDEYNKKRALQELERCQIPVKYKESSFDNFIGNDKIKQLCKTLAETNHDILITGPTGCGKTHLAVAIMRDIIEKAIPKYPMRKNERGKIYGDPGIWGKGSCCQALFITVPRLLMDLRSVFSGQKKKWNDYGEGGPMTEQDAIDEYANYKVLILDDLGAEKTTDYSLTSLYIIIDERINNETRTIVTTNLSLQELEEKMDARVASRLSGMKIIKINMPDYRKKR